MIIKTSADLEAVLTKKISELMDIPPAYLSDEGKAALEAYKAANWYCCFYNTIEDLAEDVEFKELINITGKNQEYYNVLRKIYRAVERDS